MPIVHVLDRKGRAIKLVYLDRIFFPVPPLVDDLETHLRHIRELDVRDDDILICAYPKCGTHWVWEIVQMLRKGETSYDPRSKESMMIDFMPKSTLDSLPSPRTLNSHLLFRYLPEQIAQKKNKVILINRDPRDVCVSWYNHACGLKEIAAYTGEFSDFLPLFLEGITAYDSWFDYTNDWENVVKNNPDIPVLNLYFEEMKKDPKTAVQQIARFLDLDVSNELCQTIAEVCDFGNLRKANVQEKTDPLQHTWKEDHPGIYRKGETGDWKNWFTVAESEKLDAVFSKKMANSAVFSRYKTGCS